MWSDVTAILRKFLNTKHYEYDAVLNHSIVGTIYFLIFLLKNSVHRYKSH